MIPRWLKINLVVAVVVLAPIVTGWAGPRTPTDPTDWSMPGRNLARSGASPDQVDNDNVWQDMPILWVRDFASYDNPQSELIGDSVQSIVVQGMVYVPTLSNRLHALDAETGATLWIFDAGEPGAMRFSPAVVGGVAYVGSTDGHLYAVDAASGQERWRFQAGGGGFGSSPAVTADTVYIGGRDGVFYALRISNGTSRWTYDVGAPILNSPAVDETRNRLYFGAEDMKVYALSTTSGALVWDTSQLYGQSFQHYYPVLVGDTLFIRTAPATERKKALEDGDDLILSTAGVANNDSMRAICGEDPIDIHAPWTQSNWDTEINAIHQFLTQYPEYQTWYALDVADGQQRYVVPILWTQGIGRTGGPPVVRDNNHVIVNIRSYYSNYDLCNSWYLFGGLGELEVSSGNLSILNLAQDPGDNGALWAYGIGVIGDEQNMLTLGGDVLYVGSHGDCVGGVNVLTRDGVRGMISRDRLWGMSEMNLPFMGHVRKWGMGYAGVVPYGNRLYWATGDTVGALGEPGTVSNPWTPPTPGAEPTDPVRSVQVPPLSELEPYVLEVPEYGADWTASSDLRAELEAQVEDLITTRYAPLLFMPGKNHVRFHFQDPADLFYTLSIALPYLSPGLRDQVKNYLAQEWAQYNPLNTSYYPLDEGERREFHTVGPDTWDWINDNLSYNPGWRGTPDRLEMLYAIWAYAYYAGRWDVVEDNWGQIQQMVTSAIDPHNPATLLSNPDNFWLGSVNRRTSALIAYTRMAQHVHDTAAYTWGLDAATRSLAARIEHEETNRPAIGEWGETENKFIYTSGAHHAWVPRYRDLTPEIGAALHDYAAADLSDQAEYLRVVRPTWHVAWGRNLGGEVSSNFPQHAIDIFNAQAMMLGASSKELRYYLDVPWGRGDLYYVQKLVYTIRAYPAQSDKTVSPAVANYGDVLNYAITALGAGVPMTVTDQLPLALSYVEGSAQHTPAVGALTVSSSPSMPTTLTWRGTLSESTALQISFGATVNVTGPQTIVNVAVIEDGTVTQECSAVAIANGFGVYLPLVAKRGN